MNKTAQNKLEHAKAMHTIVSSLNNEDAYMSWINCMPDEPTEDDFEFFADEENQSSFDELVSLFIKIMTTYLSDGLFINDKLYPISEKITVLCTETYEEDSVEYWTKGKTYKATKHDDGNWSIKTNLGTTGMVGPNYLLENFYDNFTDDISSVK